MGSFGGVGYYQYLCVLVLVILTPEYIGLYSSYLNKQRVPIMTTITTKTFKVYNAKTLKSVRITGYHLVKSLAQTETLANVRYIVRNLKKSGHANTSPLSIDIVK